MSREDEDCQIIAMVDKCVECDIRPGLYRKKRKNKKVQTVKEVSDERSTNTFFNINKQPVVICIDEDSDENTTPEESTARRNESFSVELNYNYWRIQKMCKILDQQDDLQRPILPWFWPKFEDEDSDSYSDQIIIISDDSEQESRFLTPDEVQLRTYHVMTYLREKYNYCMWCGLKYKNETDMLEVCPGRTRDEH